LFELVVVVFRNQGNQYLEFGHGTSVSPVVRTTRLRLLTHSNVRSATLLRSLPKSAFGQLPTPGQSGASFEGVS
jgi:hypothetical protein